MRRNFVLCLLLFASTPAMAIYRCDTGGRVTYSDQPCPNAQLLEMNTTVPRSESARQASIASQEKAKLRKLENERYKREAIEEKERKRILKANAVRENRCRSLAQRRNWAKEDAVLASGKAHDKARLRARRIAEQFELECGRAPAAL